MPSRRSKAHSLPRERQKTDKSLRAERQKADEKLSSGAERTAIRTDEHVDETRNETDETTQHRRAKVDKVVDEVRSGGKEGDGAKRMASELERERQSGDTALKMERQRVDAALEQERERHTESVEQFLKSERHATDLHLTHERESADDAVKRAVALRSENAAALNATRSALLTRDEFLAIIGYDLKNPLMAISTAAESLVSQASHGGTAAHVRAQADIITSNARDALRLLNDLLERVAIWQEPSHNDG